MQEGKKSGKTWKTEQQQQQQTIERSIHKKGINKPKTNADAVNEFGRMGAMGSQTFKVN